MSNRPPAPPYPRPAYAWYVVGVLFIAYTFSFIDRQIISLMVDPIRRDLQISDTQISLLQGLAFALFYTFLGIPIARAADVRSRRWIMTVGVFLWSLATAACGLARSFAALFIARMGVGVGEAALNPSAYSLIADYFPPKTVSRAISVYAGGIFVGAGLAYILGGTVIELASATVDIQLPVIGAAHPWQIAFFAVGLPGLAISALLLTIRDPLRRGVARIGHADESTTAANTDDDSGPPRAIPLRQAVGFVWARRRTFGTHIGGFTFLSILGYANINWVPAYLMRTFGLGIGETGRIFGVVLLIFGTGGVVGAGWIADALRRRGHTDANMRCVMIGAIVLVPVGIAAPLVSSLPVAIGLLCVSTFLWSLPMGIAPAALQPITPNQLRAQVSALYQFIMNLMGLAVGPTMVAVITDYVFASDGAVRYSLAITTLLMAPPAALVLGLGLKHYRASMNATENWMPVAAPGAEPGANDEP